MQLGTICPYQSKPEDPPHICKLLLVITNVSPITISNIVISLLYAKDVVINKKKDS